MTSQKQLGTKRDCLIFIGEKGRTKVDRKAERTARFNRSKNAKNKQKSKRYVKDKREHEHDFNHTRISRHSDRPK